MTSEVCSRLLRLKDLERFGVLVLVFLDTVLVVTLERGWSDSNETRASYQFV